jgi:hypothetical protein
MILLIPTRIALTGGYLCCRWFEAMVFRVNARIFGEEFAN